jgi:hypothetical protein
VLGRGHGIDDQGRDSQTSHGLGDRRHDGSGRQHSGLGRADSDVRDH